MPVSHGSQIGFTILVNVANVLNWHPDGKTWVCQWSWCRSLSSGSAQNQMATFHLEKLFVRWKYCLCVWVRVFGGRGQHLYAFFSVFQFFVWMPSNWCHLNQLHPVSWSISFVKLSWFHLWRSVQGVFVLLVPPRNVLLRAFQIVKKVGFMDF